DVLHAGLAVGALGVGRRAVGDACQDHAGRRVRDLVGHAPGHEARADHGHPHWAALGLAARQRLVDDDHDFASVAAEPAVVVWASPAVSSSKGAQLASLSEMTFTSLGHSMAKRGSS